MAMLAEKKYKSKWSNDPRNRSWSKDTSRFGYQMLEKMGWKSGKGLGAKEDGQTTHVKVTKKNDNIGLGADKSNVDNWLGHQQAFDSLLAELNQAGNSDGKLEHLSHRRHKLQEKAKESKRRVNYHRFVKSKDLSSYTETDMACILGQRPVQTAPPTPSHNESEDSDSDRGSTVSCPEMDSHSKVGLKTIKSDLTMQEYFAQKMKDMQAKRNEQKGNCRESNCNDIEEGDQCKQNDELIMTKTDENNRKRKKKRKKTKSEKYNLAQGQTFEDIQCYDEQDKYNDAPENGTKNISGKQDAIEKENNAEKDEAIEDDYHERKRKRKEIKKELKDSKSKKKKKKKKERE